MKRNFKSSLIFFSLLVISACTESTNSNEALSEPNSTSVSNSDEQARFSFGENTTLEFEVTEHAFGKVFQNTDNQFVFKVKNTGDKPLVIESVKASCGCTVPEKPEDPIMPGQYGEIPVIFHPSLSQEGRMTKTVTVEANTKPKITQLKFTAEVLKRM